jgi:PleD family two-component response regulator
MTSQDRLLIIDPFKNLLEIYRIFLEREKYSVETAASLKEASQKLSLEHYAVLISELVFPFGETFQMLHRVKEQSPETYIIIVTNAIVNEESYDKLFSIGVDDLILKPYSPEKILVHVKKGFRNRSLLIKKRELEEESLLDPVTQQVHRPIFNLVHFRKCLRQELKRAKRHEHALSLILTDLPDETMARNERESFTVELIKILRNNTREEDIVGRGNGSFGILLPETDETGSRVLANRLLHLIKSHLPFQSEESLRSTANVISFRTFTYPGKFIIPETLGSVLEELPI